ncbi:hypothetical protein CANCADRAFT_31467 [Tortispora caseinolytica NRRL Y-17796]|uniref:Histone-lysine N-methyltransferase, H3 lysine-36 specific n=1 Tax=Tortispora caseinolytica NRRL Y-17796 TaxID=767744 RepID=A0A1E4TFR4_9ASCO|nr:hypothetical protein CANCADRAFT_31467 [Tortispora caseinolytica NRRL Y-17796]
MPSSSPQLYLDYPDKTKTALLEFTPISQCIYFSKNLGFSGQQELMTCDCPPDIRGGTNHACGDDSDCINRLTSIECIGDSCGCGDNCQNRRFQNRQYASVSVIQTEKKGYGLRADAPIDRGAFIYEYIGDVIDENRFRKRTQNYAKDGIVHFYFMMLQQGEFIDATQKGALARYCNHSCNPNAYVDKWVVGEKLRMGIFAKRDIIPGEEITFDYNVDRYGADPQPCYCGEPNCVGVIGGKTQTDGGLCIPLSQAEALGLPDDDEDSWNALRKPGSTKRGRKPRDDTDSENWFDPEKIHTYPLSDEDVSKVMSVLLQVKEGWLVQKLLNRIHVTADDSIQRKVMKFHGYQMLASVLQKWKDDVPIVLTVLNILIQWPTVTRNKISSSQIEDIILQLSDNSEDEAVRNLSKALLEEWKDLKMAYRIPRKNKNATSESETNGSTSGFNSPSRALSEDPQKGDGDSSSNEENDEEDEELMNYNDDDVDDALIAGEDDEEMADIIKQYRAKYLLKVPDPPKEPPGPEDTVETAPGYLERGKKGRMKIRRQLRIENEKRLPPGWALSIDDEGRLYFFRRMKHSKYEVPQWTRPDLKAPKTSSVQRESESIRERAEKSIDDVQDRRRERKLKEWEEQRRKYVKKMLAEQKKQAELAASQTPVKQTLDLQKIISEASQLQAPNQRPDSASASPTGASNDRSDRKADSKLDETQKKQKAVTKLFAKHVPNMIARFEEELGHDNLKECAREIVHTLVAKEMKADKPVPESFSDEKKKKIKAFSLAFMEKVIAKRKRKREEKAKSQNGDLDRHNKSLKVE